MPPYRYCLSKNEQDCVQKEVVQLVDLIEDEEKSRRENSTLRLVADSIRKGEGERGGGGGGEGEEEDEDDEDSTTGMDLDGQFHCLLQAFDDASGMLVGTAMMEENKDKWQIWNVVVHPLHRCRGICRTMLDLLWQEATHTRRMPVTMYVEKTNPMRFGYEKLGFQTELPSPNPYQWIMVRK